MKRAIFLDRDGTLNDKSPAYYIYKPEHFRLIPGIGKLLHELQALDYLLIVITNQGGIDKGVYTKGDVEVIHQLMQEELEADGVKLTDIYYCPHHDEIQACECRKPGILLIEQAIKKYDIDRRQSWFVGDTERDMAAARKAGLKPVFVDTNMNWREKARPIFEKGRDW